MLIVGKNVIKSTISSSASLQSIYSLTIAWGLLKTERFISSAGPLGSTQNNGQFFFVFPDVDRVSIG